MVQTKFISDLYLAIKLYFRYFSKKNLFFSRASKSFSHVIALYRLCLFYVTLEFHF